MWDAIARVLTNANALLVLIFLMIFFLLFVLLARTGLISIHTESFRMGADRRERDIIRQQIEWSHSYILGLESQIATSDSTGINYLGKYTLEVIYDEVIIWIAFNHINLESDYVSIKQEKVKSIIRRSDVRPEFKTKQFEQRVDKWTEDVIKKLVMIREVYK